jgi:ketosteroid isomerase-like protein
MSNEDVARKFVEKINAHDVAAIVALMANDHVFVDSLGNKFVRPSIETGWAEYFLIVPDYQITINKMIPDNKNNMIVLLGKAGGTYVPSGGKMRQENKWETPSAWCAKIQDGKLSEWQIYSDNEPIRSKMRNPSL